MNFDVQPYLDEFYQLTLREGLVHQKLTDVGGFEIPAFQKRRDDKPCIYISAGIHGDEPAGPLTLMELLKDRFFNDRFEWLLCPLLNPTGFARGSRENASGVDLNRDYLKRESKEVDQHVGWLESQRVPDMFVSLHEDWESEGFYLYEIQRDVCKSVAKEILEMTSSVIPVEPSFEIDDHEVREPGWIFHEPKPDLRDQWPEAIFMADRGTKVSYTLETPSSLDLGRRVRCQRVALECAVRGLLLTQGG